MEFLFFLIFPKIDSFCSEIMIYAEFYNVNLTYILISLQNGQNTNNFVYQKEMLLDQYFIHIVNFE